MKHQSIALIGEDPKLRAALRLAERVAPTPATVLIVGETGTGKELVARLLHQRSTRAAQTFLSINCGAVAESLVESELFGHTRGAFTGAHARQAGKFEVAHKGTLFLDEVTSMSGALQAALLRVLQSGEYYPVGAALPATCDVRVVAAANRELQELVTAGSFRADLYYRLNIVRIALPPLRERRDDIPSLVEHFLARHAERLGKRPPRFDSASTRQLLAYHYPGNVRELESIVQRAMLLGDGPLLSTEGLFDAQPPDDMVPATPVLGWASLAEELHDFHRAKAVVVERFERDFIVAALHRTHGVVTEAAQACGLSERNFHVKLRKYGLARGERAPADAIISAADAHVSPARSHP